MKRSTRVRRTAWGGRHVEVAAEADSFGVEANVWSSHGGRHVEAKVWRLVVDVD